MDMHRKGRARPATPNVRGELNPNARLTAANVVEIRRLEGVMPPSVVATRFGVSAAMVRQIQRRLAWRCVA